MIGSNIRTAVNRPNVDSSVWIRIQRGQSRTPVRMAEGAKDVLPINRDIIPHSKPPGFPRYICLKK